MDKVNLFTAGSVGAFKLEQANNDRVSNSAADEMKAIRKARLKRMVMQDPSLARKLVAAEASPVYNAKGEVTQALSSRDISV